MPKTLIRFLNDDNGAITVDFVILTAGIFFLGAVALAIFGDDIVDYSNDVDNYLQDIDLDEL